MDDAKLLAWINGDGARKEVTKSYYDETLLAGLPSDFTPNVLTQRKRIVHVTYEEEFDGNDQTFDHATHYDYDIHGNVKTLLQDNRKMAEVFSTLADQRFKRMDYTYDLVSGNVHRMSVQNGEADQWHHAYRYDADNRITHAFTSAHTPLVAATSTEFPQILENELVENTDWQQEAAYFYYAHGPLARTEIGQDELQGIDYVYNLQGWMKGVNSTTLDETLDPGQDGLSTSINANFARDVYGFGLHYYQGDYFAINGTGQNHIASINGTSHAAQNATTNDLFNGNIRFMQTAITNPDTRDAMPMLNVYQYDQLNRLLESRSYETGLSNNEWNPITYGNEYYNAFEYDPNGNILSQLRRNKDGVLWENLKYHYQYTDQTNEIGLIRNRLYHINDTVGVVDPNGSDLDDQGVFTSSSTTMNTANNYTYDEEGRLIRDVKEEIEEIVWRVDGKVKSIERPLNSSKKNVSFDYDAMGNRIAKHVYDDNWMLEKSTYYVLDAQGNQLSMYEHEVDQQDVNYTLTERNIYGSSRLGRNSHKVDIYTADIENPVSTVLGEKFYELSNHLGNVLAVFNDVKYPIASGTTVDYFEVALVSVSDYSPFGVQLDGRTHQSSEYRYGFNGMEKDDEVKGNGNSYDFGARMYDSRVGRWLSLDSSKDKYPAHSPYCFVANSPIVFIDPNGKWIVKVDYDAKEGYSLTFVAEEGDDINSLSIQLGIPVEKISAHIDKSIKVTTDTELKLSTLGVVSDINNAINESKNNVSTNNCASFAANCNGENITYFGAFSGPNLDEMDKLLSEKFTSIGIDEARIGSIVRYSLAYSNAGEMSVSVYGVNIFTMTDVQKASWYITSTYPEVTSEELKTMLSNNSTLEFAVELVNDIAKELEEVYMNERHYSVVLLKSKDGNSIQNMVQKHGGQSLDTESLGTSPDTENIKYSESPLTNDKSAVYEKQ